ncbi:MAG TPA: DUF418 domain-containing protein [Burkholderiales bacterium]|nr:DUF418 domain-containing protein [Burkholderiales bacterium]
MIAAGSEPLRSAGLTADTIADFVIGWLASGKFLSSLALMFGIGAAMTSRRSQADQGAPRALLRRRYAILVVFGLAHMILLYPGDILFIYGIAGLILLAFLHLTPRAVALCAAALLCGYTLVMIQLVFLYAPLAAVGGADAIQAAPVASLSDLRAESIAVFTQGTYRDIVAVHASHALRLQEYQLPALPWILALFMIGYALGRTGVMDDLTAHRALLQRGAWAGITVGLAANIALGYGGPLGSYSVAVAPGDTELLVMATLAQAIGAPVLAAGYLCALALYCVHRGPIRPLAAVGRMALTAYLLQSALALAIITQCGLYDRLSTTQALILVAVMWAVILTVCPLWLRRFRFGPAEWLWRSLSYGRLQPMRLPARRVEAG